MGQETSPRGDEPEEQIVGFGDGRGKIPGAFVDHDAPRLVLV